MMSDFEIINHSDDVLRVLDDKIDVILQIWGEVAEGHAKKYVAVDTGRLKNSITYTYSGQSERSYTYTAKENYITKNGTKSKSRKKVEYTDTIGDLSNDDSRAMYVGTNVEYASDVEEGTSKQKAQPYLKPAIANHVDEYKKVANKILKGE